jgi:uncharacterized protein involved in response to NO
VNIESRRARSFAQVCQEPFRIFFPAGLLLGIIGVSLWILYYMGAGVPYPNVAHARLMIEGLMASFIFGFLGTAGPRLTSAPHFSLPEIAIVFTFDLLARTFGRRTSARRYLFRPLPVSVCANAPAAFSAAEG